MSLLPELPDKVVSYLFNLERGEHHDRFCSSCGKVTDQVAVSFSDVPALRDHEAQRLAGRLLDFVPGISLFGGKPTVCSCGAVNR